jgi:hypothetical protein
MQFYVYVLTCSLLLYKLKCLMPCAKPILKQLGIVFYSNSILLTSAVKCCLEYVRFQVLTQASIMMTAFWDIAPCSLIEID